MHVGVTIANKRDQLIVRSSALGDVPPITDDRLDRGANQIEEMSSHTVNGDIETVRL